MTQLPEQPLDRVRAACTALLHKTGALSIYVKFTATEHLSDLVRLRGSPAAQAAWHDADRFLAL